MRVYLPVTNVIAGQLVDSGGLDGPLTGFAVTPELREHYAGTDADTDLDELEYAAMTLAARGSLRLIDADPVAWRRRLVLAADVPDGMIEVRDDLDVGVIRLSERVVLDQIASVHVDDVEATHTVGARAHRNEFARKRMPYADCPRGALTVGIRRSTSGRAGNAR